MYESFMCLLCLFCDIHHFLTICELVPAMKPWASGTVCPWLRTYDDLPVYRFNLRETFLRYRCFYKPGTKSVFFNLLSAPPTSEASKTFSHDFSFYCDIAFQTCSTSKSEKPPCFVWLSRLVLTFDSKLKKSMPYFSPHRLPVRRPKWSAGCNEPKTTSHRFFL